MDTIAQNHPHTEEFAAPRKLKVALGWDNVRRAYETDAFDVDCDLSAFLFVHGRLRTSKDVVYFARLAHESGAVEHSGDSLTGENDFETEETEGDEEIRVDLELLPKEYDKIIFTVNIYDGERRKQCFGNVQNAFFRVTDEKTGQSLCYLDLSGKFAGARALKAARLIRTSDQWIFREDGIAITGNEVSQVAQALRDFRKTDKDGK